VPAASRHAARQPTSHAKELTENVVQLIRRRNNSDRDNDEVVFGDAHHLRKVALVGAVVRLIELAIQTRLLDDPAVRIMVQIRSKECLLGLRRQKLCSVQDSMPTEKIGRACEKTPPLPKTDA